MLKSEENTMFYYKNVALFNTFTKYAERNLSSPVRASFIEVEVSSSSLTASLAHQLWTIASHWYLLDLIIFS